MIRARDYRHKILGRWLTVLVRWVGSYRQTPDIKEGAAFNHRRDGVILDRSVQWGDVRPNGFANVRPRASHVPRSLHRQLFGYSGIEQDIGHDRRHFD